MHKLYFNAIALIVFISLPCMSFGQNWRVLKKTSTLVPSGVSAVTSYRYDTLSNRTSKYNDIHINFDSVYVGSDLVGLKTYNNNDQLLSASFFGTYTGNVSRIEAADSFTYNNGLLVRRDLYKHMNIGGNPVLGLYLVLEYTYNAQNLPDTRTVTEYNGQGSPDPNVVWNYYIYNANGQLIRDSVRINRSGVWSDYLMFEITYDANGDSVLWEKYEIDHLGKRVASSKKFYYYNTNGQLAGDSVVDYYGTTKRTQERHAYSYNNLGQRVTDTGWYSASSTIDVTTFSYTPFGYYKETTNGMLNSSGKVDVNIVDTYEYELFWPVSINELANNVDETVTIYPNPATNVLHIKTDKPFKSGYIYNNMGQLVKTINANARQVEVSALPAGNYYLQLFDNEGVVQKAFTVLR